MRGYPSSVGYRFLTSVGLKTAMPCLDNYPVIPASEASAVRTRVIYWFKRDLRLTDNKAFYEACASSQEVVPVFIFVPEVLSAYGGTQERMGFLVDCVAALSRDIAKKGGRLYCFYGNPTEVLSRLVRTYGSDTIVTNKAHSYTFAPLESDVARMCAESRVHYLCYDDNFLSPVQEIPYRKVFSAFFSKWQEHLRLDTCPTPERIATPDLNEPDLARIKHQIPHKRNTFWNPSSAHARVQSFDFAAYEDTRNRMDIDGTSKLSPYIRFGVLSLRQIYAAASASGAGDQFIRELAWREFWYHIKANFPELKDLEFQEKRRNIPWRNNENEMQSFFEAQTGYPIIDAAIRQLKQEGWMHNRARLIVGSFLTKDLLVDWRIGERFFKEFLVDYDEVVNAGNWQWVASVGPDPRPLRVFNPVLQARRFDPEARYIKTYIPELSRYPAHMLHDPLKYELDYFKPLVNHYERAASCKAAFSRKRIS